ncbi:unnamed protein product [Effrenium voratum]|nr:unnamed protein product [Effrenium voratum]
MGYAEELRRQLRNVEEVLLSAHEAELRRKGSGSAACSVCASRRLEDSDLNELNELNEPVMGEREGPGDRWGDLVEKLMNSGTAFEDEEMLVPIPQRETLRMRLNWTHSVLGQDVQRCTSLDGMMRDAKGRMRDAFTDQGCLQRFVVEPDSNVQLIWSLIAVVFIVWDLITVPLSIFDDQGLSIFLNDVAKVSFSYWVLDMPLHLIFGVQVGGVLELRPRVLVWLYVKSWFLADVRLGRKAAEESEENSISGFRSARFLRTMRLLRLLRLLRVGKLERELTLLAKRFLSTHVVMVLRICAALFVMLSINHIIACCWYAVGAGGKETGAANWLSRMELETSSFSESYVASLHWSLTQFTPATNNVAPANAEERLFAIFVILLAMGAFSSFIGSITATVTSLRSIQAEKVKQHNQLLQFFVERNMSTDLYNNVTETISRGRFEVRLTEQEVDLVQRLPERFKMQLHEELYLPSLLHLGFWPPRARSQEAQLLRRICHDAMSERVVKPGEDMFIPGTDCNSAYIMESGSLCYSVTHHQPAASVSTGGVSMKSSSMKEEVLQQSLIEGDALCLPALWAEWHHRGRLVAVQGASYLVLLDCPAFALLAAKFAKQLLRYLHIFGILVVGEVEALQEAEGALSDLCISRDLVESLAKRARKFSDLSEKHGESASSGIVLRSVASFHRSGKILQGSKTLRLSTSDVSFDSTHAGR